MTRATRTEQLLRELAGPGLLGGLKFCFKVFLGVLSFPMQAFWCLWLLVYLGSIRLHQRGEMTIKAFHNFIDPERWNHD